MSHAKDVLADQLLANANDLSWYVPFSESVANLSDEDAFWKPNEESNSIAEIVQHLLYWNETWQKRYQKSHVDAVPPIGNNNKSLIIPENEKFSDIKEQLLEVLLQWQDLLTKEKLEMDVDGFPETVKWWAVLGNVSTHNAYHIGQIIYIRKLQKSWGNGKQAGALIHLDQTGTDIASGGMRATLRDLARFGEMMRNNGYYNGQQIIPEHVIGGIQKGGKPKYLSTSGYTLHQKLTQSLYNYLPIILLIQKE